MGTTEKEQLELDKLKAEIVKLSLEIERLQHQKEHEWKYDLTGYVMN